MNASRVILVGFLFSLFGAICLVGNLIFVPMITLRLHKISYFKNLSRDLVFCAWRFFIFCTETLGYLRYEFKDCRELGKSGQIIIANHPSLLDVIFVLSHIRHINCIVKQELSKNIFLYPAIKASGYICNTENEELLQKGLEVLRNGESLLVFPEGTRTKDSIKFHKAPFYLAIHGAKSLKPLFIAMAPKSLQKGVKWYKTPKIKIHYQLTTKEEIPMDSYQKELPNSLRVRNLHKEINTLYHKENL